MGIWIGCAALVGVIAYVLGSIPTGYWLGRLLKGIDIREHGSHSTGATNVLRTLGVAPAVTVLLIDLLKGYCAVAFARWFYAQSSISAAAPDGLDLAAWSTWAMASSALIALLGHSRSIWIRFTGGKSAAAGLGVLVALSWPVGLGVAATFGITLAASRIVSLSSILAALAACALMVVFRQPTAFVVMAVLGAAYVIARHRANLQRLLAGAEPRIGRLP